MSKVKQGQSFIDKVVQATGSFDNALEMALLNNVSITDALPLGVELTPSNTTNKRVVSFFNTNNEPATTLSNAEITEIESVGIGAMAIGSTFVIQ